jgi:hypothetical protein
MISLLKGIWLKLKARDLSCLKKGLLLHGLGAFSSHLAYGEIHGLHRHREAAAQEAAGEAALALWEIRKFRS